MIKGPRQYAGKDAGFRALMRIVLLLACSAQFATTHAQDEPYDPDKVKAAFLFHFGGYVDWPEAVSKRERFVIGVLGANTVADELERIAPGRSIEGKPVAVRRLRTAEDIADAQIVFIGKDEAARLSSIAKSLRGRPILLVSEADGGLQLGAAINFRISERRVRFEASLPHAARAGLALSSRLLSVAMRVEKTGRLLEGARRRHASLARACAWRA